MTTTDSAATAAQPRSRTPRTTTLPGRQTRTSPLRRTSEIVLVAGTVLAIAAAFGPTWVVRIGVGIAVVAAVLACVFAWREMFSARRQHAKDMLRASQQHGHALREERTRNFEVVDTLTRRVGDAGQVIEGQRVVIGTLRGEVVELRGEVVELRGEVVELREDQALLRGEVTQRDTVIGSLRETVRCREAELLALQDSEGDDTSVRHMPRRVLAEHESTWADVPDADELWTDGSHPAVVDLRMLDTAMVLPNYEVDRRVG